MNPTYYDKWGISVYHGDCLEIMRTMPDASVHACVTDPPAGIQFMSKHWDTNHGGRDHWVQWLTERMTQAHRVLKPGGHALVWALPRTSHWTALALEDAGFDIRDCITHLYGSGFPKSMDIGKAIDKSAGATREVTGVRAGHEDFVDRSEHPLNDGWGRPWASDPIATVAAKHWNGWATALKPSSEHWWLVRKPFTGTVAGCVLQHGTGALNIAACRVSTSNADAIAMQRANSPSSGRMKAGGSPIGTFVRSNSTGALDTTQGRWPSNVVFTHSQACTDTICIEDCPVAELDRQSGQLVSGNRAAGTHVPMGYMGAEPGHMPPVVGDAGGASRFFHRFRWESKAPTAERPKVNGESHNTVKPLSLMRHLVRLVTPPGGTILDCFAGTGTTGQAARAEGFPAILIEAEADYLPLIKARLEASPKTEAGPSDGVPTEGTEAPQDLFDLLNTGEAS